MLKITFLALSLAASFALAANAQEVANPQNTMLEAIGRDDAGTVAFLLREKAFDPNVYLPNGDTPLVFAIRSDSPVTVNQVLLRSYKINVKMPNLRGETPLMLAAIKGDMDLAKKLIEMGAPVNADYGWTALHYSASTGQYKMTEYLIEQGADVNARTERGVTPLYMAARIISTPTVNVLLKAGADKTLCNDQGISPSAIAKKRGDSKMAERLAIEQCAPLQPAKAAVMTPDETTTTHQTPN